MKLKYPLGRFVRVIGDVGGNDIQKGTTILALRSQ